jgi:hypothetical protein
VRGYGGLPTGSPYGPVRFGEWALPLRGHSPIVAITSKRAAQSRPKSEACLDGDGSGKTLMRRGRDDQGDGPAEGDDARALDGR